MNDVEYETGYRISRIAYSCCIFGCGFLKYPSVWFMNYDVLEMYYLLESYSSYVYILPSATFVGPTWLLFDYDLLSFMPIELWF